MSGFNDLLCSAEKREMGKGGLSEVQEHRD